MTNHPIHNTPFQQKRAASFHFSGFLLNTVFGKEFVFLIVIFFLIFFPFLSTAQNISVKINEELVIGNSPSLPIENSFGNPETIFTDDTGNIYIADKAALSIRVFDKEGNYLRSIGQRGRGPGEFLSIGYTFLNNEGEILAPDPRQFRVTKFDITGKVLDTYSTSPKSQDINFFIEVLPLKNGRYLALYKQSGAGKYEKYASDHIFHVWDATFQHKVAASGSFKELGFDGKYGTRFVSSKLGTIVRIQEDEILLAPYLYNGLIFRYVKEPNGWIIQEKVSGYKTDQSASVTLDENDPNAWSQSSYGEETVYGNVNILSSGIFSLDNKYLVHFSVRRKGTGDSDKWIFGVEIMDPTYNFKGFYELYTINELYTKYDPLVQWKDDQDRFYMLAQEDKIPVVKVFSLDIQQK